MESSPGRSPGSVTPVARRGWMGSSPGASPGATRDGPFIYGTHIEAAEIRELFHRFILEYRPDDRGSDPYYLVELRRAWEGADMAKGTRLTVNGQHIHDFSRKLYDYLICFPTEVIPILDEELFGISVNEMAGEAEAMGPIQFEVINLMETNERNMRDMGPLDIERLVFVKGIVIRCSDLAPDMETAVFRCATEGCKNEVHVKLSHWNIEEPQRCETCGKSRTFSLIHNESAFKDRQVLKLQEIPENVPNGETPQNVSVVCFDHWVDVVRPGDLVTVTGIYRAAQVSPMRNWKTKSAVYRTYIDAISLTLDQKGSITSWGDDGECDDTGVPPKLAEKRDLDATKFAPEEIEWHKRIRGLSTETGPDGKSNIVQKLVQSFAPSIFEEDEVKKGLLCQLFGGCRKATNKKAGCRPEIHTLLCGDPSTAKSQLLKYSDKLTPRGVYTSGKGTSAVGLTASINKDPITKELVLDGGALVLSDRGLCCIDEFDKMDDNSRAMLHEVMEQQTVSLAKSGIVCSLNARTAILASANPKNSSYDPKMSVVENISLPKNLMTRFDFIWLMLDKRNRETDTRLATHLASLYSEHRELKRAPPLDSETFRRYISFARRFVFPTLTDEAEQVLLRGYLELRNQGGNHKVITATPRQLESLIRISESLAKMELREDVTGADVQEAIRLMKAATYAAAVDPETGVIDWEQFTAGKGAARRKREKDIESLLEEILAERKSKGEMVFSDDSLRAAINERLAQRKENTMEEAEFRAAMRKHSSGY